MNEKSTVTTNENTASPNVANASSKRLSSKIEKEQKKLNVLNEKRDGVTKKYQEELSKIDAEIKEQEKIVEGYREQERQAKLAKLSSIMGKKGVDIDSLLTAVANNDLYGIQEILEKANHTESKSEVPAPEESDISEGIVAPSSSLETEE